MAEDGSSSFFIQCGHQALILIDLKKEL